MTTLAVTGSTGRLGGRVAHLLATADVPQRLVVRDPSRAPVLAGAEVVQAEYSDFDAAVTALTGVHTVVMVSGSEAPDRVAQHRTFVDAAVAAGVRHLLYTSFVAASATSTFTLGRDHWATEEHIRASGLDFTFLRDNFYADFLPLMAGADGVIRGPAGEGRVAAVARDDIADAVVAIVTAPDNHRGMAYEMTGPAAITLTEAASIITTATGHTVSYHPETLEEAFASRAAYGAPDWEVEAWVSTYTAIAAGDVAAVSDHIKRLTGHPATSLAELLAR
jgi:NAD(P)H dehydrogenase (quinone)